MSTTYSASVVYGYTLSRDDLVKRTPNPQWGKVKFDPDSGEKVTQFTESKIELKVKDDYDAKKGEVARYDAGDSVILGVQLAETEDLNYSSGDPLPFAPVVGTQLDKVAQKVKEVLAKAGLEYDETRMGHYLVGSVF